MGKKEFEKMLGEIERRNEISMKNIEAASKRFDAIVKEILSGLR